MQYTIMDLSRCSKGSKTTIITHLILIAYKTAIKMYDVKCDTN